jgi:hypothetical protein
VRNDFVLDQLVAQQDVVLCVDWEGFGKHWEGERIACHCLEKYGQEMEPLVCFDVEYAVDSSDLSNIGINLLLILPIIYRS